MGKAVDLKEKFKEYFHELEGYGLRSERFYDLLNTCASKEVLAASMAQWLEAAFIRGARVMAQDTLHTLDDYGTAVAGVAAPLRNPTDCYDAARDSLMVYFTQVLQDAEQ